MTALDRLAGGTVTDDAARAETCRRLALAVLVLALVLHGAG